MKKEKKVFVMGKVYTITETNISEIERAVQEDLDNRPLEYSTLGADPRESIIGEDALIITGDRYNGFIMPSPLPPMPYLGYIIYNLEQSDFLEIYKESAKRLGASKIKDAWLEINPGSIILRVQTK